MNSPKFLKSLEFKYIAIAILPLAAMFYTQTLNLAILAFGEHVLLETAPVDPTDVLRGDYVTLDYKVADIGDDALREAFGDTDEDYDERGGYGGRELFVTLRKDEAGVGMVKSVSASRPDNGLYLTGTVSGERWSRASVTYGIGRYYVPEGTGREIERKINGQDRTKVLADVRVLRGRPVIKSLKFVEAAE